MATARMLSLQRSLVSLETGLSYSKFSGIRRIQSVTVNRDRQMISIAAQKVLQEMIAAEAAEEFEDAEIVCQGRECWLGYRRTSRAILNQLLRHCLVRDGGDASDIGTRCERYTINEDGRKAAEDRTYINPSLRRALSTTGDK